MYTPCATVVHMTTPSRYTHHSDDVLAQLYPPKEPRYRNAASFIRYSPYGLQPKAAIRNIGGWAVTNGKHASLLSWAQLVQYMSQGLPADRIQDTYNSWHKLTDSTTQPPPGEDPAVRHAPFTVGRFHSVGYDGNVTTRLAQRHGELWVVTGIHRTTTGFTWPGLVEFMGTDASTWRILK